MSENWDRARLVGLIPEAADYEWVPDLSPVSWIFYAGTPGQAIAYANLFWPEFVEHQGCVMLQGHFNPENFRAWMQSTNGDRRAVEAVINHLHILDIFDDSQAKLTLEQVLCLGRFLKAMWAAKLKIEFPEKTFSVVFPEDVEADLIGYEITFFQSGVGD